MVILYTYYNVFCDGFWWICIQVERIIADRLKKDGLGDVVPEYLVKWQGHSYAEATW